MVKINLDGKCGANLNKAECDSDSIHRYFHVTLFEKKRTKNSRERKADLRLRTKQRAWTGRNGLFRC